MRVKTDIKMEFDVCTDEAQLVFYNEQTGERLFTVELQQDNMQALKKYIDFALEVLESKGNTVEKEEE